MRRTRHNKCNVLGIDIAVRDRPEAADRADPKRIKEGNDEKSSTSLPPSLPPSLSLSPLSFLSF